MVFKFFLWQPSFGYGSETEGLICPWLPRGDKFLVVSGGSPHSMFALPLPSPTSLPLTSSSLS